MLTMIHNSSEYAYANVMREFYKLQMDKSKIDLNPTDPQTYNIVQSYHYYDFLMREYENASIPHYSTIK